MVDEMKMNGANDRPIDILLAEDNQYDADITLRVFEEAKLKNNVYVVKDGKEALDFVYHEGNYQDAKKFPRPDLILLDIKMPKVDGFQVLEKLKSDLQYKVIPVIMLTSSKTDEDMAENYDNSAASYMQKPVNYDDFVKAIDGFNFYWYIINKLPDGKRGV